MGNNEGSILWVCTSLFMKIQFNYSPCLPCRHNSVERMRVLPPEIHAALRWATPLASERQHQLPNLSAPNSVGADFCDISYVGVFNCEKCGCNDRRTPMHASCEFVRSIGKNSKTLVIQKHTTVSMKLLPMTRKPAPATEGMLRG